MSEARIVLFVAMLGERPRGVGKTLLMTDVVYKEFINRGREVISNYHLNFPHTYKPYREIIDHPEDLYDANVLLDEIFIGGNSRKFMSKDNIKLIEFLTQIRKRKCDVFITAQTSRQLDAGIRDQVDIIVEMRKHKRYDKETDTVKTIPLFFDVIVRDRHDWDPKTNILDQYVFDGRKTVALNLYDTDEIITIDGSISGKDKLDSINKENENNTESEVSDG